MIARWSYQWISGLLGPIISWVLALISSKAKERRNGILQAITELERLPRPLGKRIWIHCASWGEFEMALPLVEALKKQEKSPQFVFSFFSPSGYNNAQLPDGTYKVYLCDDQVRAVRRFQNAMKADLAVWVKYEFWLNHLEEIHRRNTPLWIWNASFRSEQFLFKPWAKSWLHAVSRSTAISVQYEEQAKLIRPFNPTVFVLGDARAYQTRERLKEVQLDPHLLAWAQSRPCMVIGSSWPAEEQWIRQFWAEFPELSQQWNWIIVPHEISRQPSFSCPFLSQGIPASDENKLWVDQTGQLRGLYTVAKMAIVGGGYGSGLHNVYEPLAAGAPVMCGPETDKFPEAALFEKQGFLLRVDARQGCVALCEWMAKPEELTQKGQQAKAHIHEKAQSYSEELARFLASN